MGEGEGVKRGLGEVRDQGSHEGEGVGSIKG